MSSQTGDDPDTEQQWPILDEQTSRAVNALRDFARAREKRFQDVVSLTPLERNGFLNEFYLTLNDSSDEKLKGIDNINRVKVDLKNFFLKVANIDIGVGKVSDLLESTSVVEEPPTHKEVSMKGPTMKKHTRQRTFTFDTNELRQIYMSDAMNMDKPETLQNKVFFDVCMYICNRGKDFLRLMTKSDFEVSTDQNGIRYVWLKYDSKFSFQEVAGGMTFDGSPGSQIGERMYERKGDPKCPVLSYTAYVIHLHPMSDAFWQRPKRSILPTDFVWYDNISIGNSTLNKLMNRITQSAGLPDSYPINAIKSSYIPVIESICRSALFGSQQFRRILQMKHSNHADNIHLVRKRHSEGSLSIASTLSGSALFRPRLSEPRLPVYMLNAEEEALRCSSASPILRDTSQNGQGHTERGDHNRGDHNRGDHNRGDHNRGDHNRGDHMSPARDFPYRDEMKSEPGTAHILHAKEKCLDIVHSLEVRDIKSFINWMKTFEVKHGPQGLTVTCQPVNAREMETKTSHSDIPNNALNQQLSEKRSNSLHRQGSDADDKRAFIVKSPEFDCSGGTFCCTSAEIAPVKITVPNQETVLLTGLPPDSQVLIHNKESIETQSSGNEQFLPLHTRIFTSRKEYDLEHINSVSLKQDVYNGTKQEKSALNDFNRSDSFKEERSIPMKKRIIVDQLEQNHTQSFAQSISPQSYGHTRSPPLHTAHSSHTSSHRYIQQTKYMPSAHSIPNSVPHPVPHSVPHSIPQSVPQHIPEYRPTFADTWGYMPMHKRQKFSLQGNNGREEGPLDLIKQS